MPLVLDILNEARRYMYAGSYRAALRLATRAVDALEASPQVLDATDVEFVVDGLTIQGLALRGLGDDERALGCLVRGIEQCLPAVARLEDYVGRVSDRERQRNFLFGQMMVVEIALERLAPLARVGVLLRRFDRALASIEMPLLTLYRTHLQALVLRANGGWRRAVEIWREVAAIGERLLARGEYIAGYPPAWYLCHALATLEVEGAPATAIMMLVEATERDHVTETWERSFLAGVRARLRPSPEHVAIIPSVQDDRTLDRLEIDRWLVRLPEPSEGNARAYWSRLEGASLAIRLCYGYRTWQFLRPGPAREYLTTHLSDLVAGLPISVRRDYQIDAPMRGIAPSVTVL